MQAGSAQAHTNEMQVGVEVQLLALLHSALLGAQEGSCVHLEEAASFSESS